MKEILDFCVSFFRNPALFMGLVVAIGLILQRKPIDAILKGIFKGIIGMVILLKGVDIVVSSITPLANAFSGLFNTQSNSTLGDFNVFLGQYGSYVGLILLCGFVINIIIARYTRFKTIYLTGNILFWYPMLFLAVGIENNVSGLKLFIFTLIMYILVITIFPYILRKPKYNVKTKFNNNVYVRQVSMWVYADAIIPCILVGQIIGRWGNFFNQEVYGAIVINPEVSFAWLKTLMPAVYDNMFINGSFRQPLFLYESFANFWVFLILYVGLEFVKFRKAGDLGILYFVFYGIVRLIMEPFRDNDFEFVATIVTSVLFIVIGITLLVLNHLVISKNRKTKVWFMLWVKTKYYLNFNNWRQVRNNNLSNSNTNKKEINKPKTYGFIKPPVFTRTEEEMLFYNNH